MQTKSINNRMKSWYYKPKVAEHLLEDTDIVNAYISGAYDYDVNKFSYAIIFTDHNDSIIDKLYGSSNNEKYLPSKSIAGEVFGGLYAIKYAIEKNYKKVVIHYNFEGMEQWVTNDWKTNKPISQDYVHSFFKYSSDIYISTIKGKGRHSLHVNNLAYDGLVEEFKKLNNKGSE